MIRLLLIAIALLSLSPPAHADDHVTGKGYDFMAGYRAGCGDKIYASCLDQAKVLNGGLQQAKADNKLALVVFGFNTCPPCNVLDLWLKSPKATALMKSYVQIDLSIFDKAGALHSEIFTSVLPALKLSINQTSPYGVPLLAVVDPATKQVLGEPIVGFNPSDQTVQIAYLSAHAKG